MFDLKNFRTEELKITQLDLANLINVDENVIINAEKHNEITLELLLKVSDKTGKSLEELINYKNTKSKSFNLINKWENTKFIKLTLSKYIQKHMGLSLNKYMYDIDKKVKNEFKKPKIAMIGHSDVGKSTLINHLIGSNKMPSSWTPTTAITIYIRHKEEKPEFIDSEVNIFRLKDKSDFDIENIEDVVYYTNNVFVQGDINTLNKYGTRQGDNLDKSEHDVAVVFIDSPILTCCDIIDLPGFGTGDRESDDIATHSIVSKVDILVYLCVANAFMRATDMKILKDILNNSKISKNNLFILATQAHNINNGDKSELENILDYGCSRLCSTIKDYKYEDVRKMFFTYAIDKEILREDFENNFKKYLEKAPDLKIKNVFKYIEDKLDKKELERYHEIINRYKEIINTRYNYRVKVEKEKEDYTKFQSYIDDKLNEIKLIHNDNLNSFNKVYKSILSKESIIEIINNNQINNTQIDIDKLIEIIYSKLYNPTKLNIIRFTEDLSDNKLGYEINFGKDFMTNYYNSCFSDDLYKDINIKRCIIPISFIWKGYICNKIIKNIGTKEIEDKIKESINEFWINSINYFEKEASIAKENKINRIENMDRIIKSYDIDFIEENLN